jgi:predicted PurR-regulated permease PerM
MMKMRIFMNRIISWLPNLNLRKILTVFLVGMAFLVMQAFSYGNQLQAQAKPLTPEASAYDVDQSEPEQIKNENDLVGQSRRNLKDTADNIREKLNLDQPIYPGTKEFLNDVQDSVKDATKAVTGNDTDS